MNEKVNQENIEPLYSSVRIGDDSYRCADLAIDECPLLYHLEEDDKGINHVKCIGKDDSYQKTLDAQAQNTDINYLLAKYVGGDPAIVEAVESGLKFLDSESNGGSREEAYDDPMAKVETYFDTKQKLKDNPLLNEFLAVNDDKILENRSKFFDKWDKFIASKKAALESQSKPKEVSNNEQK